MLADGEYYRVGGHAPLRSNVRIIAATHQNLEERVRLGLFREDLMHRLNVVRLRLPPLRERPDDIPPLARHFLQKSARELAVEPKVLTAGGAEGAVRVRLSGQRPAAGKHLPLADGDGAGAARRRRRPAAGSRANSRRNPAIAGDTGWQQSLDRELAQALARGERNVGDRLEQEFEKTLIRRALTHTGGHRMEAAAWLGWGRNTLTRKIQELGLEAGIAEGRAGRRRQCLQAGVDGCLSAGESSSATRRARAKSRSTISSITTSGFSRSISAGSKRRPDTKTTREKFSASIGISGIAIESR